MNSFDKAFRMADDASFSTMGVTIRLNGKDIQGILMPLEETDFQVGGGRSASCEGAVEIRRSDWGILRAGASIEIEGKRYTVGAFTTQGETVTLYYQTSEGYSGEW